MTATATGDRAAMARAISSAASCSSARGTTFSTSPHWYAVAASTKSPVRFSSSARPTPTIRGSRCVPPPPGMSPSLISGCPSCGVVGRDPDVAAHRQLEPAAEAEAVDRGDERLVGGVHARAELLDPAGRPALLRLGRGLA